MEDFVVIFVSVAVALISILGIWIKKLLEKQAELKKQVNDKRRHVYNQLLQVFKDMFLNIKKLENRGIDEEKIINFKFESLFWASEDVIFKLNDWSQSSQFIANITSNPFFKASLALN